MEQAPLPDKKYQVIYADPPWRYSFSKTKNRKIENQYPTMSIDELKQLSIPAERDSVLFLWATAPKLLEALAIMEAWGFVYKTNAVWDKGKFGMGYWFRGQHELLLVGTQGHFSPPIPSRRLASVFKEIRGIHSRKPICVRDAIESYFPDCTRIELFAREGHKGWASWGNEALL